MLDATANFIKLTASTGYDQSATGIVVLSGGSSLPAAPFNMTWWNATDYPDPSDDPNREIVRVTNVSGNTLTVTRGQEGPAASVKNSPGKAYQLVLGITAKTMTDIQTAIAAAARYAWQTPGAVTGIIDGINASFALPWTPNDPRSVVLWLNQQPYFETVHFTVAGNVATYISPPDASFSGSGHYATGQ